MTKETIVEAASTLSDGPFVEVLNSSTSVVDVCGHDSTHDACCHKMRDVDTTSYHSADCGSKSLHECHDFRDNSWLGD